MRHATSDEDRREGARQEARAAAAPGPRWLRLGLTLVLGLAAGATLFPRKARGGAGDGARER